MFLFDFYCSSKDKKKQDLGCGGGVVVSTLDSWSRGCEFETCQPLEIYLLTGWHTLKKIWKLSLLQYVTKIVRNKRIFDRKRILIWCAENVAATFDAIYYFFSKTSPQSAAMKLLFAPQLFLKRLLL